MKEKLLASIEAEEDIFSCILQNPHAIKRIVDILVPSHFYRDRHRQLYEVMLKVHQQGRKCTVASVWDEVERSGIGDWEESDLWGLQTRGASHPVLDHVSIVMRKATMRQLVYAAGQIAALAYEEEEDAVEQAEKLIYEVAMGRGAREVATLADALDRYVEDLEQRILDRKQGIARGIPTGFSVLDHAIGGLQPGALYTLGALTGMGKTAWALNTAMNVVQHCKHALFFSLEMPERDLVQRIISSEAIIDQTFLRDAEIDDAQMRAIKARATGLRQCDLKIDDSSYILSDIKSKIRSCHARKALDLVVIDYLQLVKTTMDGRSRSTRTEEIAQLSGEMKRLAHELDIPILVLAQLNRNVEHKQVKEPVLADINESGAIARDSDVVLFLYALEEEIFKAKECQPYQVILKIAKNRNGRLGEEILHFNPRITTFRSVARGGQEHEDGTD